MTYAEAVKSNAVRVNGLLVSKTLIGTHVPSKGTPCSNCGRTEETVFEIKADSLRHICPRCRALEAKIRENDRRRRA